MAAPTGFSHVVRASGEVVVRHHGRAAANVRGAAAAALLAALDGADDATTQHTLARVTGNYRRGNERAAARHPRNG